MPHQFCIRLLPVHPGNLVILAIGIIVAALRPTGFVAHGEHDGAATGKQCGQKCADITTTAFLYCRISGQAFRSVVPGVVFVMAVAAILAIGIVVLVVVGDEVEQGEPIMGCEEIDTACAARFFKDVR
ncbi:hypothetical protein D3C73_891470 [compost metagenome]